VVEVTNRRQFVYRWLPMLLWMAAIFVVSGQAKANVPSFGAWDTLLKKTGHFLAYGLLAMLALRGTKTGKRPYLLAFLITVMYAASDEYHQSFVLGRHGRLGDVLIDSAGALLALWQLRRIGEGTDEVG